jgi:hypothetical protein
MKSISTRIRVFLLALFLCCFGKLSFAQTVIPSNNFIANDHLTSPTVYEWDVYLQATSVDFWLRSVQYSFWINPGFVPAGATVTVSFLNAFSELNQHYNGGAPQWDNTNPLVPVIKVPSMSSQTCFVTPPDNSNLTLFVAGATPKRVIRFRLTSSLPLNCVSPNLSMIRPTDNTGTIKCAVSYWDDVCATFPMQQDATYSTFRTDFGGPTLTSQINNLNTLNVSAVSPASAQLCGGAGSQTFSVTATGNGTNTPLSYQWMLNGTPLSDGPNYSGTHASSLTATNPTSGGSLTCQVYQCSPTNFVSATPSAFNVFVTDDGNACTVDGCDPSTGIVSHVATNVNDNDACTADACDPSTGVVSHSPVVTDDGDACTVDACAPATGLITHTAVNINDNDACTADACDPSSGTVSHTAVSVDDGNACTVDACNSSTGAISHTQVSTDDNNVCTSDVCDPATGNIAHNPISVEDNNPCTSDGCNPVTGPSHTPIDFSDANLCDIESCDPATGNISHTPVNTSDNNACTNDACDPATGAISHSAVDVNDNDGCTTDACNPSTGAISHTPVNINDNNACTVDACDPSSGSITHTAVPVDDFNACTTDACDPSNGNISHTAINISDNDACTADACDPSTGAVTHTAVSIDDNDACTTDACNPSTGSITHTAVNINDNNACTADACDPSSGVITHTAANIDDANACTNDACNPSTGAITHTAVNISDNNACTADACDPSNGDITHTAASIDDANVCTNDACDPANGNITHTAININDNNACTMDGCDPVNGEYHNTIDPNDNNLCTNDYCDPSTGVHNDALSTINDNDACTADACDPSTGAVSHTPAVIDDLNACTNDACDPATGSITHTAVPINDNDACTADACDPSNGDITHTALATDDGNACTTDGCDPSTGVYHNSLPTDDFNPCTIDACDPATGTVSNTDATPVVTVTPGTISCFGGSTTVVVSATGGQGALSGTGSFTAMAGPTTYTVSDAAGCMVDQTITLAQPSKITIDNISSTPTGCSGSTGTVSASATGGTGNLSYMWQPGNHAGDNVSGLGAGTYTVTVTDQNGCTSTSSIIVTQSGGGNPNPPGAMSGATVVCKGQCGLVYSVPAVPGALSYIWTMPAGMTGSSTSNSISLCITSKFKGGFICVKVVNQCGTSSATCLNVLKASNSPASPTSIFGPAAHCANQTATYSISAVAYASSYVWTVNNGMQILSGQGTTSVQVKAPAGFSGGTVKVYAKNCKGNSGTRNKNVKNGVPGNPGSISGPGSVCKSQTYTYTCGSASNAVSYTWTVTGGATIFSGQGTTSVKIKYTTATQTSAVVSVVANGACASSAPKTKNVSVSLSCRTADGLSVSADVTPVTDLTAYPNPTSGKATVSFNVTENTKCMMRVMDMLGNVLISESISAVEGLNTKDLSLDQFAKGVYFVSIQTENNDAQTLRIVVE